MTSALVFVSVGELDGGLIVDYALVQRCFSAPVARPGSAAGEAGGPWSESGARGDSSFPGAWSQEATAAPLYLILRRIDPQLETGENETTRNEARSLAALVERMTHGPWRNPPGRDRLRRLRPVCPPAVRPGAGREAGRAWPARIARPPTPRRRRFGIPDIEDVGTMLARDDIDLVYIATPPFLHHPQAMAALRGRQARDLREAAGDDGRPGRRDDRRWPSSDDRLLVANLMQRYNPICDAVGRLIESQGPGRAAPRLPSRITPPTRTCGPDHWFWDRSKSGGIFVEHGVHFFDLFAGWLGPGTGRGRPARRAARAHRRRSRSMSSARVRYGPTVLVNFYHGFHQTGRMDRQEMRLVFERGDVTLYEWVPTRVRIHAIADEAQTRDPVRPLPRRPARRARRPTRPRTARAQGRHKTLDVYQMLELTWGDGTAEVAPLRRAAPRAAGRPARLGARPFPPPDESPRRNGRDSLAVACEADRLAQAG